MGSAAPELHITSAASSLKSLVTWAMGLLLSIFVGLLSIQSVVASGADSVTAKTAKFLIGSFIPVVGSSFRRISSGTRVYPATQDHLGGLRHFSRRGDLPASASENHCLVPDGSPGVAGGDLLGTRQLSTVLRACASVLGLLIAIVFCFALLVIISTSIMLVMGGT